MSSGKVLLGLLAGVAAGATLGILFAPDKGETTRRRISQKGEDYAEGLEDKFNEFLDNLSNKFETAREEATRIAKDGKFKAENAEAEVAAMAHRKM
jgi:gas vesicle protein